MSLSLSKNTSSSTCRSTSVLSKLLLEGQVIGTAIKTAPRWKY